MELSIERAERAIEAVLELPAGGTAVGTGINTHPEFGRRVAEVLAKETGIPFVEADEPLRGQRPARRPRRVPRPAADDRRHAVQRGQQHPLARQRARAAAFYEVKLPDRQPGSSIMPGKVNPVMCESMMQVAARVMGNDQTVAFSGATGGQFQLNIMMPVMGHATLESVAAAGRARRGRSSISARSRWRPTPKPAKRRVEKSLSMVTSLNPHIGYEKAAALAKEAFKTGKTIRELCREQGILPEATLNDGARSRGA